MIASGTAVRTSMNPAARASAETGGTPALDALLAGAAAADDGATVDTFEDWLGAAERTSDAPQPVLHAATSTTRNRPTVTISALSRIIESLSRTPAIVRLGAVSRDQRGPTQPRQCVSPTERTG